MAEAEAQLRTSPAHRLRPQSEHAWSLDTPNGVAVHVGVSTITVAAATAVIVPMGSTTGLRSVFRLRQLERTVELPIDGDAARLRHRVKLVTDKKVDGLDSIDTTEGLSLCWGEK